MPTGLAIVHWIGCTNAVRSNFRKKTIKQGFYKCININMDLIETHFEFYGKYKELQKYTTGTTV